MRVERVPWRVWIADTTSVLSSDHARLLKALGIGGVARYVETLTPLELDVLTSEGLGVMGVQYARVAGVTGQTGDADGAGARKMARAATLIDDATLWCDRESTTVVPSAQDEHAYQAAWWAAAGGDPGVYRGAGIALDSVGWWQVPFRHYWRSFSAMPNVAHRGDQLIQLYPGDQVIAEGVPMVDVSVVQTDYLGDRPLWQVA